MVQLFITIYSVDLAHHEIFRAKVGKGGINCVIKHLPPRLLRLPSGREFSLVHQTESFHSTLE